jgi:hypothetical protein
MTIFLAAIYTREEEYDYNDPSMVGVNLLDVLQDVEEMHPDWSSVTITITR